MCVRGCGGGGGGREDRSVMVMFPCPTFVLHRSDNWYGCFHVMGGTLSKRGALGQKGLGGIFTSKNMEKGGGGMGWV